jgi:SepF-like predicted cell division protein (DUF552 family)
MVFDKIKKSFSNLKNNEEEFEEDYLEIDVGKKEKEQKILVKLFTLNNYNDINSILESLRDGYTIAVIDIRVLRKKDSIELKRAISKIKKTADALEGSIAGFGENIVIVTPSFAKIHKEQEKQDKNKSFY